MEDLTGQVDAVDSITAAEWNNMYQEFKNLITQQGFTMSVGDLFQFQKAIAHQGYRQEYMVSSSGVADAYIVANGASQQNPRAFVAGIICTFRPTANNATSSPTIDISGIGIPKGVLREDGSAIQAGDFSTTRDARIRYDGVQWLLMNSSLASPVAALPDGYRSGLTLSKNPAEPIANFQDIQIEKGSLRETTNAVNLSISTPFIKAFDATLAKGTGLGGYPLTSLGARAISTWYRVFLVGRNTGGEVEAGFDTSSTATNLLTDLNTIEGDSSWIYFRQIGWVRTTASDATELVPFENNANAPNEFIWTDGDGRVDWDPGTSIANGLNAETLVTLDFCPPLAVALLNVVGFTQAGSGADGGAAIIRPTDHPKTVPSRSQFTVSGNNVGTSAGSGVTPFTANDTGFLGTAKCRVDASRQLIAHWFGIGPNFYPYFDTIGFEFGD